MSRHAGWYVVEEARRFGGESVSSEVGRRVFYAASVGRLFATVSGRVREGACARLISWASDRVRNRERSCGGAGSAAISEMRSPC